MTTLPDFTDVSRYQEKINWKTYAAKAPAVIIRVAAGTGYTDPFFQTHWGESNYAGVLRGAYHFFKPDKDGSKQADFFCQQFPRGYDGELPIFVDVEESSPLVKKAILEGRICKFIQQIKSNLGVQAGIYTSAGFWNACIPPNDWAKEIMLWVANYGVPIPAIPHDWGDRKATWTFHQYTAKADAPAYGATSRHIDLNRFNGTLEEFNKMFNVNILPPPAPTPITLPCPLTFAKGVSSINIRVMADTKASVIGKLSYPARPIAFEELSINNSIWVRIGDNMWVARQYNGKDLLVYVV